MAFIVDIAIVILFIISIASGLKKGLIKTLFGTLSLILAIIFAISFGKSAGALIKGTEAFKQMSDSMNDYIASYFDDMLESGSSKSQAEADKDAFDKLLKLFGADTDEIYDEYQNALQSGAENAKEDFAIKAANVITDCAATLLGTLAVFILSLAALKLLRLILEGIFKLPVLNAVNKIGGFALGVVRGALGAAVLCTVISIIIPYIPSNPVLYLGMENDTVIYKAILGLNPLLLLLFN